MTIEEHSEQSYTEIGNYDTVNDAEDHSLVDTRTGDFTETYREELLRTPDADKDAKQMEKLIRRQAKRVQKGRRLFATCILIVGVLVVAGAFLSLSKLEKTESTEKYLIATSGAQHAALLNSESLIRAVEGLSEAISAAAYRRNETFPFVTVDLFEVVGRYARKRSSSDFVAWSPLVSEDQRDAWMNYTRANAWWVEQSRFLASSLGGSPEGQSDKSIETQELHLPPNFFLPVWQASPLQLNATSLLTSTLRSALNGSLLTRSRNSKTWGLSDARISKEAAGLGPFSILTVPIFSEARNRSSDVVGFAYSVFGWHRQLRNLVPSDIAGVHAVIRNKRGQSFTFEIRGSEATYLGEGDRHDTSYDSSAVVTPFATTREDSDPLCEYTIILYSSNEFQSNSTSALPVTVTCCIALSFAVFTLSFLMYDHSVQRKSDVVADLAKRSLRILSTLFPTNVRERMFADGLKEQHRGRVKFGSGQDEDGNDFAMMGATRNLKTYLDDIGDDDGDEEQLGYAGRPIADLFPQTTVMFADIAGFTAWSTAHSPAEVFQLLETLYGSFDEIAQRRRVFKVETVGDCYVAVSGVPEPEKNHAVVMSRFARDCMYRMRFLTRKLEVTLGPDTGDLCLRAGLHSGPVTAGVLRGERSRFQLFGDTMNTAARMEGTGFKGRIQISQDTADCLVEQGKENWFTPRTDMKVIAKGIGEVQTYWLCLGSESDFGMSPLPNANRALSEREEEITHVSTIELVDEQRALSISSEKISRLIDWNVDTLLRLLKRIVAFRKFQGKPAYRTERTAPYETEFGNVGLTSVVEEVKEVIHLPQKAVGALNEAMVDSITLPPEVVEQLYAFVTSIAALYNANPFHSFEHASHVTMSVVKLLSRIVAPNLVDMIGKSLHDHTYGITSDPLTQFSCVFSALIHDVDHSGVPNAQLIKENSALSQFYNQQSPAEQNSIDLSWQLLMDSAYDDLRRAIYADEDEYRRFRQLVVNSVMATDIVDKDLKMLRNARWAKAFRSDSPSDEEDPASPTAINRKATIVIEHLIQASDVAHTMQHWHIYRKWNERFFFECYKAYLEGRAEKNPAEGWYQGEMGFYDFYIVPLARKLKDCGVFGVSSDEYLNYAVRNRREWENKGREVVLEMVEKANRELGVRASSKTSSALMQELKAGIGVSTSHSLSKTSHARYGDH